MNIVESIERYLAGSSVSKGVRTRLVRARDEIVKLRRGKQEQWQGLTEEEIIIMSRYNLEYAALIGEVQGKLKEKNT